MRHLLFLLVFLFCPALLPRHQNQITCLGIVAEPLNMFNAEGEIVMVLEAGTHVDVTGIVREDFARVQENGIVGFVHYVSGLIIRPSCFLQLPRLPSSELPEIDPSLYRPE